MKRQFRVFVDSDVVISSIISQAGAAYALIFAAKNVDLAISDISLREIIRTAASLRINLPVLKASLEKNFRHIKLGLDLKDIDEKCSKYTLDRNDSHVVAGAIAAHAEYLVTYNIKHFRVDKIKQDLGIKILTPGLFLQFQRSLY